jgi:hypothetical protein
VSGRGTSSGSSGAARFRARRLSLANGEQLLLGGDGTIERRDGAGSTIERLTVDDPGWAAFAIRFGIREAPLTVAPHGRDGLGPRHPA